MQFASDYVSRQQRQRQRRSRRRRRELQDNWFAPDDESSPATSSTGGASTSTSTPTPTSTCLSPLQKWFVSHIESIGVDTWEDMNAYNITSLAYYYKHHVSGDDGTAEFFGKFGDRTDEMLANHHKLTTFWAASESEQDFTTENEASALASNDILLLGMHGIDLADNDVLDATLQQIHQIDYDDAVYLRTTIQKIIDRLPDQYNNPLLTANAMAIQSLNPDGSNTERDSIIIGDGIFEFLDWLGLGDHGPFYIHSHEFGHHLQYNLQIDDSIGDGTTIAVVTRWWEMMADSFGSYFNAHSLGGAMDYTTLLNVHRAAFSMGDCEDLIGTHHGTPRQRECASNYGADLALVSFYDGGYILPPVSLQQVFNEQYSSLVQLDSEQCKVVVDETMLDVNIYGEVMGYSSSGTTTTKEDYSAYLHDFTFDNPFISSELENAMDKPPPILLDENGTEYVKDDPGFWGTSWEVGLSPRESGGACHIGTEWYVSAVPALLYILLVT